ncbi:AI-2E family transporter [Dyella sp.]|jgi:predicted PurR-regulated permease PerM|uniref:AI-2E family transporter n=1 Tax=Dyella sp. TaxID=1869338 RepID=UPI002D76EA77|nr:AI-2E family transporter [Dyella sp.]HET6431668.1 AI-2E family transporter [Dyella sp.]
MSTPEVLPGDTAADADFSDPAPAPPREVAPAPARVAPGYPPRRLAHGLQTARGLRRHIRGIRLVLNGMLLLAVLYTITLIKALLIPLVLAAFLGVALNPIVAFSARRRVPRWLSASVLMISLVAGIGFGVTQLAQPAMGWFHDAPAALKSFVPKLKGITQPLEAASRATQSLVGGQEVRVQPPRQATVALTAWDVLSNAPKVLAAVLTVMLLVFFFLIYGDDLLRRLVEIVPNFRHKKHAVSIVRSIQTEVSHYILTTAVINMCLGAVTATMLWLLHVPDPLLWGSIAMIANFIPYVGAITTTTVLLLVGLMNFREIGHAVLPALAFASITVVEGNMITPMILGRRMRVSPVAILLWLLLWGFLWGIPGALLAVPMLTSAKLISERVRGWQWFALMVQR